ncbi:MAG: GFA family protein [Pseudomonadota bacterium]
MLLKGGCLCGAVRYTCETESECHYLCHCSDCRRHGGGAWHAAILVAAEAFHLTGEVEVATVTAESGTTLGRANCPICGTHIFAAAWPEPERVSIKAGTLDDQSQFHPRYEIWTRSRVDWAPAFPDLLGSFEKAWTGERPRWR